MVPCPRSPSRWRAPSIVARTSFTPAFTADICSNARAVLPATARASVVLPVPGGPQNSTDDSRSDLDERPQRPTWSDEVVLADDVIDRARPQPGGERRRDCDAAPPPRPRTGRQPCRASADRPVETAEHPFDRPGAGTRPPGRSSQRGSTHRQAPNSTPSGVGSTVSSRTRNTNHRCTCPSRCRRMASPTVAHFGRPFVDRSTRDTRRPARPGRARDRSPRTVHATPRHRPPRRRRCHPAGAARRRARRCVRTPSPARWRW